MTLGQRIVVMSEGKVQQFATPDELYHHPANLFVAGFIGNPSMNFFDGVLDNEQILIAGKNEPIPAPFKHLINKYKDTPVKMGIRPEDIYDAQVSNHVSNGLEIQADIKVVERLGNENLVHFKKFGVNFTARIDAESKISGAGSSTLILNLDKLYLFDQKTGEAYDREV
jgi:multiple sugar transport system ATP-binding protein